MGTDNKALVVRMNEEVWNEGNLENLEEMFSADVVEHFLPDGSGTRGLDALREHIRDHRRAFPDWREKINHIVADGNFIAIQYTSTGTNEGDFLGNPATGRQICINEMCIFRVEDGKIAELWLLPDLLSLKEQLGLLSH